MVKTGVYILCSSVYFGPKQLTTYESVWDYATSDYYYHAQSQKGRFFLEMLIIANHSLVRAEINYFLLHISLRDFAAFVYLSFTNIFF